MVAGDCARRVGRRTTLHPALRVTSLELVQEALDVHIGLAADPVGRPAVTGGAPTAGGVPAPAE